MRLLIAACVIACLAACTVAGTRAAEFGPKAHGGTGTVHLRTVPAGALVHFFHIELLPTAEKPRVSLKQIVSRYHLAGNERYREAALARTHLLPGLKSGHLDNVVVWAVSLAVRGRERFDLALYDAATGKLAVEFIQSAAVSRLR